MDFFAQQDAARKKSARLTVVALVFAVFVAAATGFVFTIAVWCGYLSLTDRASAYVEFLSTYPNVCVFSHVGAEAAVREFRISLAALEPMLAACLDSNETTFGTPTDLSN